MMRHRLRNRATVLIVVLTGIWSGCQTSPSGRAPENLALAKEAVVAYHDSGRYESDVTAVAEELRSWLVTRVVERRSGERLAVVFDIDETVLSNYAQMKRQDFGYVPAEWEKWVDRAEAAAITPMRDVYQTALRLGYDVIFITGRREPRERAGTEANLRQQGMGHYTRLILAEADSTGPSAVRKAATRAALEAEGFTIVASVGDQTSDLVGGHAERTFKLPNPFYLVE